MTKKVEILNGKIKAYTTYGVDKSSHIQKHNIGSLSHTTT